MTSRPARSSGGECSRACTSARLSPAQKTSRRASLLELAANDEVCYVSQASPERVPGDEGTLHLVLLDEFHDRILVHAEGVLDQVDVCAVRADFLGLARPA